MKTRNHSAALFVPVIVTILIAFASCNNNRKSEAKLSELAPQPEVAKADQVFTLVDELPVFKGGDAGLLKYIAENTTYPEEAKKNKLTGRVIVKLVVEKDCSVSNVEIEQSVNALLDNEASRVVSSLPRFETPGKKGGEAVRVQYMIPITFTLK